MTETETDVDPDFEDEPAIDGVHDDSSYSFDGEDPDWSDDADWSDEADVVGSVGRRPAGLVGWVGRWSKRRQRLAVGFFLVLVAVAVGVRLTPNGLVTGGDSTTYIAVAKNIVAGQGITSPFVNEWDELAPSKSVDVLGHSPSPLWPPGFPVAIATGTKLGLTVEQSARLLSIASLAGVVLAAGWLAARLANGSPGAMLAAGLIICFSPGMHLMATAAYSDLPAAAVSTAAVIALVLVLEHRRAWPVWLALFWVLAAAATLTRVGAAGMVFAAVWALLRHLPASWRTRGIAAAIVLSSLVPLYLWRAHVAAELGGTTANITSHARWDAVRDTPIIFYRYLVPETMGAWQQVAVVALCLLALLSLVRAVLRRLRSRQHAPLVAAEPRRAMVPVIVGYVVVTLGAAFFLGALLTVDGRTYLSVLPLLVALVVGGAAGLFARPDRRSGTDEAAASSEVRFAGIVPALLVALVVLAEAVAGWNYLLHDPLVAPGHVLGTPDDRALGDVAVRYPLLFSNIPSNLYVLTGLSSAPPPVLTSPSSLQPNPDHDKQLDEMGRLMRERNGAFVYFLAADYFGSNVFLGGFDIVKRLDLVPVGSSPNGVVFAPRQPGQAKLPDDFGTVPASPPTTLPATTVPRSTTTGGRRATASTSTTVRSSTR